MLNEEQLVHERTARKSLELQLAEARATIAKLEAQLATARTQAAATAAAVSQRTPGARQREVLSDCSDLSSGGRKKPVGVPPPPPTTTSLTGGVRKKKSKERNTKPKIPGQSRYWTAEEHKLFLEALRLYGHKDLRSISAYVGTRNMTQCRTHSQKWQMKLMREAKRQTPATAAVLNAAGAGASSGESGAPTTDGENKGQNATANGSTPTVMADIHKDKYSISPHCGIALLSLVSTTFDN